ncbi:chemotaxis-specific protein-glutamate methyltransferase CheB [Bosea caraganae]|uniref:Protein-glutamate methylesterase/protein-glutamine glutaminase n=1 Tax=Bosea caraganae TaxID=2763117 RepID=A0A370L4B8_9HYPH|nr:chemotaxis-specific protein-glutamate methyltransferase CheB [Bosea caraganae]RDJ20851.1 chemotaxis-specific protein-glutamate methyltransferase CheB [Bosea caraganae]RDJ22616.1 chemotaxis-specific protein-glutamate methyltransferase CheB [Bosea caraganae]
MIRLLIVDDSALMRRFLGRIFEAEPDFEIATARDGAEALQAMSEFRPQVVTLDIAMPNMDGLACLDRIMVEHPCPVVMVSALTEHGADETLRALQMGAVDFIPKPQGTISLHAEELAPLIVERIRAAASIKVRTSRRLAERVRFRAGPQTPRSPSVRAVTSSSRTDARLPDDCVVLIGASTGGPPALDAVLSALPEGFAWPIVVAQHMPAAFTGPLSRRLDKLCALSVVEVTGPTPIEAGTVYIGRGDADVLLTRRNKVLTAISAPADPEHRWHPSVDRLVRSAIDNVPAERLIGLLMTGMGNDGAAAIAELRALGGHTIAEAKQSAVVWGMPGELVKLGGAADVIGLPHIGGRLLELAQWR